MSASMRPQEPPAALQALRKEKVPPDGRPSDLARRQRTIAAIGAGLRSEGRRHASRFRRYAAGALAVAAVVALFAWTRGTEEARAPSPAEGAATEHAKAELFVTGGVVVITRMGQPTAVSAGHSVAMHEGQQIRTASDGHATLSLPRGVRATFGTATDAWLDTASDVEQRMRIGIGTVTVSVPKPGGPRTVAVVTPDTQVVVHGTEFTVGVEGVEPKPSTVTRVAVSRGSVLVLHHGTEQLIGAGSHWSSAPSSEEPLPESSADVPADAEAEPSRRSAQRPTARGVSKSGALGEQNRLFQAASKARKAGDDEAALRYLDELLARFPKTELAQEASIARFRTLKRLGRDAEAARQARRYLSTHRDGPARDEAREIVLDSTSAKNK